MRFVCGLLLAAILLGAQDLSDLAQKAQSLLDSNPAQAASLYQQILKKQPDWAPGWLYLGASLYGAGQDKQAVDALSHGVQLAPREGAGWGFMGLAEFRLNHPDTALADFGKGEALGLGPNHGFESAVRQAAAFALIRESRFDEAVSQLQPLANYDDHSPGIITAAGMCALAIAKDPRELDLKQQEMVTLAGNAQWAASLKQPADAEAAIHELLRKFPDGRGVHYAYALLLMQSDQQAALEQLHKATSAHPDLWPAWILSATLETRSGNPEIALADVKKTREIAPPMYHWLCDAEAARANLAMGHAAEAIPELKSALASHPEFPQLHHMLAQAYRKAGNMTDADKQEAEFARLMAKNDPAVMPY